MIPGRTGRGVLIVAAPPANGGTVLHELDYDDSDAPAIGLVPPGVTWDDVYDHIKIAHHPLLVTLDDGADHAARTGTARR